MWSRTDIIKGEEVFIFKIFGKEGIVLIPRLEPKEIKTHRLTVSYLEKGEEHDKLLVLIHGNTSSNVFYLDTIERLSAEFHVLAPDLRGYGFTERLPIDATQGLRGWSEDLHAFFEALSLTKKPHLLGWSMGGGVIVQYALDHPDNVASLILVNPLPPYGYSGTREDGTPNNPSYSGTGGGTVNVNFVKALAEKDISAENPFSVPNVLKNYFAPGFVLEQEWIDLFVDSMTRMGIGEDYYPGDFVPCAEWPHVAPGTRGIGNAMSRKYVDLSGIVNLPEKPPLLWIRGAKDAIVSDTCLLDIGYLGKLGYVPGWPGDEVYPPHAMIAQSRRVFEEYRKNGGISEEYVFENAGHGPMVEAPQEFCDVVSSFIR